MTLSAIVASCDINSTFNKSTTDKPVFTQLDTLINFDTIVEVYSHSGNPPKVTDDALEEGGVRPPLYVDSINRWTNSLVIIDSLKKLFPKLTITPNGVIETSCCGYHDLFIVTKRKQHTIFWLNSGIDGSVMFDDVIYTANKDKLNKLFTLLNRKIIRKEIQTKDSIHYNRNNIYNKKYMTRDYKNYETMFVYELK